MDSSLSEKPYQHFPTTKEPPLATTRVINAPALGWSGKLESPTTSPSLFLAAEVRSGVVFQFPAVSHALVAKWQTR
jgi:hypothetical protein